MTWVLNLLIGFGVTTMVIGLILLGLSFIWVGWKRDLQRFAKSLLFAGAVVAFVPMVAKPVIGWLNTPPSAEEVAAREADEKARTREAAERAAAQDAEDARKAQQDAAVQRAQQLQAEAEAATRQPAPVTPVSTPRWWIVPSGTAGYFMTDTGVVDASRAYLPGSYQQRPGGKIYLVDTSLDTVLFSGDGTGNASTNTAIINAVTTDDQITNVQVSITWMVVPENVALFKSRMGHDARYTPIFIDIVRSAVRTATARRNWQSANGPLSVLNRESFSQDIQNELDRHTTSHFRRLGFGDQSGNIIRFGEVSLRNITHETK